MIWNYNNLCVDVEIEMRKCYYKYISRCVNLIWGYFWSYLTIIALFFYSSLPNFR